MYNLKGFKRGSTEYRFPVSQSSEGVVSADPVDYDAPVFIQGNTRLNAKGANTTKSHSISRDGPVMFMCTGAFEIYGGTVYDFSGRVVATVQNEQGSTEIYRSDAKEFRNNMHNVKGTSTSTHWSKGDSYFEIFNLEKGDILKLTFHNINAESHGETWGADKASFDYVLMSAAPDASSLKGLSAYEIAQQFDNFQGTPQEWLDSLKGETSHTSTTVSKVVLDKSDPAVQQVINQEVEKVTILKDPVRTPPVKFYWGGANSEVIVCENSGTYLAMPLCTASFGGAVGGEFSADLILYENGIEIYQTKGNSSGFETSPSPMVMRDEMIYLKEGRSYQWKLIAGANTILNQIYDSKVTMIFQSEQDVNNLITPFELEAGLPKEDPIFSSGYITDPLEIGKNDAQIDYNAIATSEDEAYLNEKLARAQGFNEGYTQGLIIKRMQELGFDVPEPPLVHQSTRPYYFDHFSGFGSIRDYTVAVGDDVRSKVKGTLMKIEGAASWGAILLPEEGTYDLEMFCVSGQPEMSLVLSGTNMHAVRVWDMENEDLIASRDVAPTDNIASITKVVAENRVSAGHYLKAKLVVNQACEFRVGHYTRDLDGLTYPSSYSLGWHITKE